MKRTIIALTATATLALTACSGGDSEPTVTKTVTAESAPAKDKKADKSKDADKSAEDAKRESMEDFDYDDTAEDEADMPDDLPTFKSVKEMATHDGLNDIIEHDGANCEADITQEGVRTDDGTVVTLDVATCWSKQVSDETVIFAYSKDGNTDAFTEWAAYDDWQSTFVDVGTDGTDGKWGIIASNEAQLAEVMTGLGIDPKQWGVNLTDEEVDEMLEGEDW